MMITGCYDGAIYVCSADQILEIDALRYTFMQDGDVYSA